MLRNQAAVGLAVDGHNRGKAARANAAEDVQGELAVLCDTAFGDLELALESVQDLLCTLDVASGAKAYGDGIFALGLHGEEAVEGNNAVNASHRDSKAVCNYLLDLLRKISEVFLGLVQDVDEFARVVIEGSADVLDGTVAGFIYFYLGSTHGLIIFRFQT